MARYVANLRNVLSLLAGVACPQFAPTNANVNLATPSILELHSK